MARPRTPADDRNPDALMPNEQPVLHTQRLTLRPFAATDASDVQRLAGVWEVASTTLTIPHPYPDGAAEAWIGLQAEQFASGRGMVYAITLRDTGELAGAVGLALEDVHARGELGYWVARPLWGTGIATEAARPLLAHGFETLGLNRIHAVHFGTNPASGRVMQKLGMRFEGIHRQHVRRWGHFHDVAEYAILSGDWRDE
jgi:RimJ/RimL family protein N-acetyltransferase